MKSKKVIVALLAALSVGAMSDNITLLAEAAPNPAVVNTVEADLMPNEVEIVVDWLETGVNTPQEIAERYKNPSNRYNILQAAIRRNVPMVGAITEVFYGNTNGVLPGGVNSSKVINDPNVAAPAKAPAVADVPAPVINQAVVPAAPVVVANILPGEAEYKQGLEYESQNNEIEAFYYFKQAADKMHPKAAHKVANMYYDGKGTTKNKDTALSYFKIAANGGDVWGEYAYAWILIKDEYDKKEGLLWMQKAADHQNPRACYQLAKAYDGYNVLGTYVRDLISADKTKSIEYYRKAKDTNTAEGYYYWGLMYFDGRLTEKNYAEAAKWFTKAMDMGDTDAKDKLIDIYSWGGYGLDKNPDMVNKLKGKL